MEKGLRRLLYRGPDRRALHEQFARWPEIDPSFRSFRLDSDLAVDATTRYTVAESYAGWLAWPLLSSRRLEDQHRRWMDSFKRAAETTPVA